MRKVNFEAKVKALNEFRIASESKTFTYNELIDALGKVLNKNKAVIYYVVKLFPYETIGRSRIYEMPKDPIHIDYIKAAYNKNRIVKPNKDMEQSEEAALAFLSSKGYQIRKCIGFDLERFQKENPELYKKYLKYEILQ